MYVYFVVQFFSFNKQFQNSEQNSLKQNENFIVSCDQLGDTFRAAPTLLSMVSMTGAWWCDFRQLKLQYCVGWCYDPLPGSCRLLNVFARADEQRFGWRKFFSWIE